MLSKQDADRRLVLAFAIAIPLVVFAGFARSYFLRAWFSTRGLPPVVHVHGLLMTSWIVLFVTQVALVSKGRVDLHRKLGAFGAALAATALGVGEFIVVRAVGRRFPDATTTKGLLLFVAFDGINLVVFAGLVFSALLLRKRSDSHKRLMLMAVVNALPPALGRIAERMAPDYASIIVLTLMVTGVFLCLVVDTKRHHRLHPVLAWAGGVTVASSGVTLLAQMAT
jgi:hypothetical protein